MPFYFGFSAGELVLMNADHSSLFRENFRVTHPKQVGLRSCGYRRELAGNFSTPTVDAGIILRRVKISRFTGECKPRFSSELR